MEVNNVILKKLYTIYYTCTDRFGQLVQCLFPKTRIGFAIEENEIN